MPEQQVDLDAMTATALTSERLAWLENEIRQAFAVVILQDQPDIHPDYDFRVDALTLLARVRAAETVIADNDVILGQAQADLARAERGWNEARESQTALWTRLEDAQDALARAREALERYGQHGEFCPRIWTRPKLECNCGLDAALAQRTAEGA